MSLFFEVEIHGNIFSMLLDALKSTMFNYVSGHDYQVLEFEF